MRSLLRREINSKDEIIKLLITDRNIPQQITNKDNSNQDTMNGKNNTKAKVNDNKKKNTTQDVKSNNRTDESENTKNIKKSISIVGDSIIRDIKSFKLRKSVKKNENVYVKPFPGSSIQDMEHYIKPSLNYKPEKLIIHTGTNNLRSNESSNEIAENIKLALEAKKSAKHVAISCIVARDDDLNTKGKEVNSIPQIKLNEGDIFFIDTSNVNKQELNASGLHLNAQE